MPRPSTAEHERLADADAGRVDWRHWGPYLSERAWGTVREDYSADGSAWEHFPHDHARSRAYRWNEDGLAGFSNRFQNLCMAVALWNERDPILKERLFGLTGPEGNHGEDVKEYYYYLDGTPTHSYMRMLYRYPQVAFPYARLVEENRRRSRAEPELELVDALREALAAGRYFDVTVEYAKFSPEDILCRISAVNQGPDAAPLRILPMLWFRNDWSWGHGRVRPELRAVAPDTIRVEERHLGERWWCAASDGTATSPEGRRPRLLFTENETNTERLFGVPGAGPYVKDGIDAAIVHGQIDRVNPLGRGSRAAAHFWAIVGPGEAFTVRARLSDRRHDTPFEGFDAACAERQREADDFHAAIAAPDLSADERLVQRQALAGLLWSKQFYHYNVALWLRGDPAGSPPPEQRQLGRNAGWDHFDALEVLSMPDTWEYPWFAAWDLAFHAVPLAMLDPAWAKRQLILLLREWYMHPNGQLPAYEWAFDDANPPVHAWAVWQVYRIGRDTTGEADTQFLEQAFHKLLLNFTWWVNRKDQDGNNVFQGGFLGLDNIGVFDRSAELPTGGQIEQADGTAWMAAYCLNMLTIALELARTRPAYEDIATKFFEHFIYIANAFYDMGRHGVSLWDDGDGFFYDVLHTPDGGYAPLRVRSFVGLIPLLAVHSLEPDLLARLPAFRERLRWFLRYRPQLIANIAALTEAGIHDHVHLAIVGRERLARIAARMFDADEFLSDHGLRSLSRHHARHPFECQVGRERYTVRYEPAESETSLFGGNSNWRGPVWFPINYLMIDALRTYDHHYGDTLKVEVPRGSGRWLTLGESADDLTRRLSQIFLADASTGRRPCFGDEAMFQDDRRWRDHIPFYEYFHGDTGAGLGASHQTGWTALIATMLNDRKARPGQ